MSQGSKREQIVSAADRLFYQQGFEHTSFADIADAVQISRGNFYYHFKSKDAILDAVIESRLASTEIMLQKWQLEANSPVDCIRSFIHILIQNRAKIKHYGCPVGSMCMELVKLNHPSQDYANRLFVLFRRWLKKQFKEMGFQKEADKLAMHLLAQSQGVAALASAFCDENFIKDEVMLLENWLDELVESSN